MNKKLMWIGMTVSVAVLCFYASKRLMTAKMAHAQVRVVPFVLQAKGFEFETDPQGKLFKEKSIARRSDGATAEIFTVGQPSWGKTARTVTYSDGTRIDSYDLIAAKTTWHARASRVAAMKERLQNPPADCVLNVAGSPRYIGSDVILGHKVAVVQSMTKLGRITSWSAHDLGCQELQFRLERVNSDGSFQLQTEQRPVSLTMGEPPSSLFDTFPNYEELKPSEVHRRFFAKLPVAAEDDTRHEGEQLDQQYQTQH